MTAIIVSQLVRTHTGQAFLKAPQAGTPLREKFLLKEIVNTHELQTIKKHRWVNGVRSVRTFCFKFSIYINLQGAKKKLILNQNCVNKLLKHLPGKSQALKSSIAFLSMTPSLCMWLITHDPKKWVLQPNMFLWFSNGIQETKSKIPFVLGFYWFTHVQLCVEYTITLFQIIIESKYQNGHIQT